MQSRYKWEAELQDGAVITEGSDLSKAIRFSLIPQIPSLPRHDIVGVRMVKRFSRGFKKSRFNDSSVLLDEKKILWTDGSNIVEAPESLEGLVHPGQMVRRRNGEDLWHLVLAVEMNKLVLASPFSGLTKALPTLVQSVKLDEEYVHCLVAENFRMYVNSSNGVVLITPKDYELYL